MGSCIAKLKYLVYSFDHVINPLLTKLLLVKMAGYFFGFEIFDSRDFFW